MACFPSSHRNGSRDIEQVLGPLKNVDSDELVVYRQAALLKGDAPYKSEACSVDHHDMFNTQLFEPLDMKLKYHQTYNMWKASMDISWKLSKIRKANTIYIQPLNEFPEFLYEFQFRGETISFFDFLKTFLEVYFHPFDVVLLENVNMEQAGWNVTSRIHETTQQKQYLVKDIQKNIHKHLNSKACACIGIIWTDLYPSEQFNFVLGEAQSSLWSGVLCFGRYEPKAYVDGKAPPPIECLDSSLIWRMIKVLSHETCHIFGLNHCTYFECNMNESTSIAEAMSQPLFLCPVCLRKLQKVCKFRMKERYKVMLSFMVELQKMYGENENISKTVKWFKKVIHLMMQDSTEEK